MNPEIFAIRGFEDELVEVGVMLKEVEPTVGFIHVGVAEVVFPVGVRREWETEVGSFAQGVLGSVGATDLDVELVATVAGGDDNGAANEGAEWFEDFAAELLQDGDELRRYGIVNTASGSCC